MIEVHEISALMNSVKRAIAESTGELKAENEALRKIVVEMQERLLVVAAAKSAPGPSGPQGPQGERGESIVGPAGPQGEQGVAGPKGEAGEAGPRGEKGDTGERGVDGKDGRDGREGKDGRDGKDGTPGRDAVDIYIHDGIEEGRHYPIGSFAAHEGGLKRWDGTQWRVIVRGSDSDFIPHADDPRRWTIRKTFTGGDVQEREVRIPAMLYCGVFKPTQKYSQGDTVTYSNSCWVCIVAETSATPGVSPDWKMAARGERGKPGENGKDGAPGPEGKPGKDLRYQ